MHVHVCVRLPGKGVHPVAGLLEMEVHKTRDEVRGTCSSQLEGDVRTVSLETRVHV